MRGLRTSNAPPSKNFSQRIKLLDDRLCWKAIHNRVSHPVAKNFQRSEIINFMVQFHKFPKFHEDVNHRSSESTPCRNAARILETMSFYPVMIRVRRNVQQVGLYRDAPTFTDPR